MSRGGCACAAPALPLRGRGRALGTPARMLQPGPALAAGALARPKASPGASGISSAPRGTGVLNNSLSLKAKIFC